MDRLLRNCHTCRSTRTAQHASFGVMRLQMIPQRRKHDISMDFVMWLPLSNECNPIIVVADRLIKMRHLISCMEDTDRWQFARIFIGHVSNRNSLPLTWVFDRGQQFISELWNYVSERLGIEQKLLTCTTLKYMGRWGKSRAKWNSTSEVT